jgi:DNA-3-methyladenine glycosylase II
MTLYRETGQFDPTPPFDFAQSLAFLGLFAPTHSEQAVAEHSLTKAVSVCGQTVAFMVEESGTVEAPRLAYALCAAAPFVRRLYGYHQVKFPTPFENAC